jgi:hypothetical protein
MNETDMVQALLWDLGNRYFKDHPEKNGHQLSCGGFINLFCKIDEALRKVRAVERKLDGCK